MMVLTPPKKTEPYAFTGPYAGCFELTEVAMDRRHIFLLHEILCSWPFKSALEIGSFNGASATAFVEAINRGCGLGAVGSAMFCDVSVSRSLIDVAKSCRHPERVRVSPMPSWVVLNSATPFDFILVDACHDAESVAREIKPLLARRPLCIMAHDTNATDAGYRQCEGARNLKNVFKAMPEYSCLEDSQRRDGERTDRGLFFATSSGPLYRVARSIFENWR